MGDEPGEGGCADGCAEPALPETGVGKGRVEGWYADASRDPFDHALRRAQPAYRRFARRRLAFENIRWCFWRVVSRLVSFWQNFDDGACSVQAARPFASALQVAKRSTTWGQDWKRNLLSFREWLSIQGASWRRNGPPRGARPRTASDRRATSASTILS